MLKNVTFDGFDALNYSIGNTIAVSTKYLPEHA
jgi:hypothetical protein